MYKASLKLPRIHKTLSLSYNLIIDTGEPDKPGNNGQTVRQFDYEGNTYFSITGRPYITLDISTPEDKRNGWSTYRTVNLNQRSVFDLKKALGNMIKAFRTVKDLFYIDRIGRHVVNTQVAQKIAVDLTVGTKTLRIVPAMIPDDQNDEVMYEGCILFINRSDYYTYMSFNEMEYLYDLLQGIDMNLLQLQLLTTIRLYNGSIPDALGEVNEGEIKEIGNPDSNNFVTLEKGTIPKI